MSGWIVPPELKKHLEASLSRMAKCELGGQGLKHIRDAPYWFRGVHCPVPVSGRAYDTTHPVDNCWPVLLTHRRVNLIELFAMPIARDPSLISNYRAFLSLCRKADDQPQFLSAAGETVQRWIEELGFLYQTSQPGAHTTRTQAFLNGYWDEPTYHGFGQFNPRVADEIVAMVLACSDESGRAGRGVLPLVRQFVSWQRGRTIRTDEALRKLVARVLDSPRTVRWCVYFPFTASLSGIDVPRVAGEAAQKRMIEALRQPPPELLCDLPGARFPTI
jgi:hypothetical protein